MPVKKSQDRWNGAHVRLRALFDQRAGMSQLEFAEKYGLGTQGMVWQYLSGYRPLNYEAAAKFAKGLNCRIDDFSPEMAHALREEILPVLGRTAKATAKAALLLALLLPPFLADRAQAAVSARAPAAVCAVQEQLCIMVNSIRSMLSGLAAMFLPLFRTAG